MKFNLNKTPNNSNTQAARYRRYYKPAMISVLCLIMGIILGRLIFYVRNQQAEQPDSPVITDRPEPTEPAPTPTSTPTSTPTPTAEPSPEPPVQSLPENDQPTLQVPRNPSEAQINCLRYGGGAACFADQYLPDLPEPTNPPEPSPPRQLPPSLPDLPDSQLEEPDLSNVPIAVISGREVKDWTPDYNLPPMSMGVCPPSWVIAYQNQLFCNRRLILTPSRPIRRPRGFQN